MNKVSKRLCGCTRQSFSYEFFFGRCIKFGEASFMPIYLIFTTKKEKAEFGATLLKPTDAIKIIIFSCMLACLHTLL